MTLSEEERIAAKIEELDRLIADLQGRRRALLAAGGVSQTAPEAPTKQPVETKAAAAQEAPPPLKPKVSPLGRSKDPLEKTLDSLPWKSFKKKEGEWAFLRDREGMLIDELQSAKDFVDRVRKEGGAVVGNYRYQVSEDKFLNRYYVGTKAA